MVKDAQVKGLFKAMSSGKALCVSAMRADMSENTARKYVQVGRLPSEVCAPHTWRTRKDPFTDVWPRVEGMLETSPGLEAKTVFDWLVREYPGRFQEGQLRTLQRRFRRWRARHGEAREVFFPQVHHPGELGASDFTDLSSLGITILGVPYPHLLYHFVLTWSNWEDATVCFAESYESLHTGFQNALWRLGGTPAKHRTDCLTAAVNNLKDPREFTLRYEALLSHYGTQAQRTNPASGNENGDVEQRHHRLKRAVDQALLLRGSRDFDSSGEYETFLRGVLKTQNGPRMQRLKQELPKLHCLPARRLADYTEISRVLVNKSSTIRVRKNTYSVHSRLIGYHVDVRLYADALHVHLGPDLLDRLPRLHGANGDHIQYRHIIDWLVRKPGAFANYRYRAALFPTSYFRIAYDQLCRWCRPEADREYLRVLYLAARESETLVNEALRRLIAEGQLPRHAEVKSLVQWLQGGSDTAPEVQVLPVDLGGYDALLEAKEVQG